MPPAIAAVAVSLGATLTATALGATALVSALVTVAASLASSFLMKKPKVNKLNQGAELRTKYDPNMTRQVMVGQVATGGSVHFTHTRTDDPKKPNRYLYRVIQLSDRPIVNIDLVLVGTEQVHFVGDITTGWRAATSYLTKGGAPCLWMRAYLGSDNPVADSTLVSETGGLWTNAHIGVGLAYVIVKMDYDADAFPSGEPELTFVLNGAKVYDDRYDSTKPGGSGTQRLNDYSTWYYSSNTAVIAAQYLRGFYTNGVLIAGVQAEERDLSTPMLFSAYSTCDSLVDTEGGEVPRYRSGLIINANESASDILIDLQAAMDGKIFDRGGAITLLPGANRVPAAALTDEDIIWTAEKSWQPKASLEQMLNHVTGNFVDAGTYYQERDLPVLSNAQWELDDGGERFSQFFSFRAVVHWEQGQRITKRIHQASRHSGTVSFVCPIWMLELEQGDWFTLTSERWGFTTKYFEVQEFDFTADVRCIIIGREVHPDTDNWDWSVDERPRDDSTWIPPTYDLPVPNIYAIAYTVTDPGSGVETYNVEMGLSDDPALYGGLVRSIEYQYTWGDMSVILDVGVFPIGHAKTAVSGLAPDTLYYVRARTRDLGRYSDWTDWEDTTTDNAAALASGYGFFLTDPSITIAANSDGSLPGGALADAGGSFVVMQGGTILTTGVTYSVASETGVDVSIDPSTGVYTTNTFAALKGYAVFRAIVAGGPTIDLGFRIAKAVAGESADPVYGIILSNASHTIPTDGDGNNGNFGNAFGQVRVFDGVSDIAQTAAVSYGTPTAVGCTGTVNISASNPVSGQNKGYYRVTAMSADTGYLDIPITVGGITYTQRFSVAKSRSGASIRLYGNRDAINYDSAGAANPSLQTTTFNVVNLQTDTSGITWEIAQIGGSFVSANSFITILTALTAQMTRAQFEAVASTTAGVVLKASKTINGQVVSDTWTVVKVQQGASAKALKIWPDRTGITFSSAGVADPSTQTTTFVAEKINTTATVTWSVKDMAGNPKTPVTSYLSAATGDTVTMGVAGFNAARGTTDGVTVSATLTDIVTLNDSTTVMKVAQGAAAVGFVQDSPVPVSQFISQTWYRPTSKEWYRAASVGCAGVGGSCWVKMLGVLSAVDLVDTPNLEVDAINYGNWIKQGSSIIMTNETFEATSVIASIPVEGARVLQRFIFIYEVQKTNPVLNDLYEFTVQGLVQRVSSGLKTYAPEGPQVIAERWSWASDTGVRYFGKRVGTLEFVFDNLPAATYTVGYRVVVPAGFSVTFFPYRYTRIEDMRATK